MTGPQEPVEVRAGKERLPWSAAVVASGLTLLLILAATLAGSAAAGLQDTLSGALEPGARAPGDLEALGAWRLGAYFAGFQITAAALTLLAAPVLRRWSLGPVLPLFWPAGGLRVMLASVTALIAMAVAAGLAIYAFDPKAFAADVRPFAEMARSRGWWVLLLAAAIGAPIAEELLFRGFLFSGLRASPLGFTGAAVISAAVWTALHASYSPYGLALLMLIGFYFAWLRERTGTLLPSMAGHALYNGLIVLALAAAGEDIGNLA